VRSNRPSSARGADLTRATLRRRFPVRRAAGATHPSRARGHDAVSPPATEHATALASVAASRTPPRPSGGDDPRYRLRTRICVFVHRSRLDGLLADGADPASNAQIALRARQITQPAYRRALAESLEDALAAAERRRPSVSAAVPLAKREVYASRAALLGLCRALRENPSSNPAGVALAQRLLTDGAGPLYVESRHDALWHALRTATLVLELDP
jgi:hypothetical protein